MDITISIKFRHISDFKIQTVFLPKVVPISDQIYVQFLDQFMGIGMIMY